ncbi:MAG: hypothetical protein Q8K78_05740, partial [Planctomycetaceae bacterium]|nr:hypothetical protein [Planctomycetaceae bacterium]
CLLLALRIRLPLARPAPLSVARLMEKPTCDEATQRLAASHYVAAVGMEAINDWKSRWLVGAGIALGVGIISMGIGFFVT